MNSPRLIPVVLALASCTTPDKTIHCDPPEQIGTLPQQLDEASGIARARSRADVFWVHNDSEGEASLYVIRMNGELAAQLALPASITQSDWEDIDSGPCPTGDCVYIADIGDNLHARADIAILRFPEPTEDTGTIAAVERFAVQYPDGAHDAEAMFVRPDGDVFIITKGRDGPVAVYRYPAPLRADERVTLQLVQQLTTGLVQLPDMITGATASADGNFVAIRSYSRLRFYHFVGDTLAPAGEPIVLTTLREPQGEGIAFADDSTFLLVSERRSLRPLAPLSRIRCTTSP